VLAVAWYRFRGTFRRRWAGYLTVVVLVGVLSGLPWAPWPLPGMYQLLYP
jgi:hypothetical protein